MLKGLLLPKIFTVDTTSTIMNNTKTGGQKLFSLLRYRQFKFFDDVTDVITFREIIKYLYNLTCKRNNKIPTVDYLLINF